MEFDLTVFFLTGIIYHVVDPKQGCPEWDLILGYDPLTISMLAAVACGQNYSCVH